MLVRSRQVFSSLVITLVFFSSPLYSAECNPSVSPKVVEESLISRDAKKLTNHLVATAEVSGGFVESQGTEGLEKVSASLVEKLFESHSIGIEVLESAEVNKITDQLKNGLIAACESLAQGDSDDDAEQNALKTSDLMGGDSAYYFLLGTTNSLQGDGSFSSGLEASLYSSTIYSVRRIPFIGDRWFNDSNNKVTGIVDLTYSEIGEIAESEEDGETDPNNPFSAGGGFLRFGVSLDPIYTQNNNTEGLGLRVGTGFSTLPSETESEVTTKGRVYAGIVFKANYGHDEAGRNGRGEIFLGVAHDDFWKYEETVDTDATTTKKIDEADRIVVDGRLDLPGVFTSKDVRLHGRLFADVPTSGKGPSDIRISLLLTVDIGSIFQLN